MKSIKLIVAEIVITIICAKKLAHCPKVDLRQKLAQSFAPIFAPNAPGALDKNRPERNFQEIQTDNDKNILDLFLFERLFEFSAVELTYRSLLR